MKKKIIFAIIALGVLSVLIFCENFIYTFLKNSLTINYLKAKYFTASVFFKDSVTEMSLKNAYEESENSSKRKVAQKIKILIVPGHDAEFSGTEFKGLKELELNLELGEKLYDLLKNNSSFEVYLSQNRQGYNPQLLSYFEKNRESTINFIENQKGKMESFISAGEIKRVVNVEHNFAPGEVALKLFGINKWANKNGMDIILHIHFNDYAGRKKNQAGKYSGFSIYIPESQYSNAKGSRSVAESIYYRLRKLYSHSNLPKEDGGVVEDQELIAIGSNNTLDGAGILIEYGYIYEPLFVSSELRHLVLSDMALQTYLGILDFFGKDMAVGGPYATSFLPFEWNNSLEVGFKDKIDILRLQAALTTAGFYPPSGETKNDCPLTGYFGSCTEKSVKAFQEKYEILPAEGFVGQKTRVKLNELFGN